ncbi:MAG: CPBP family intramembrane metalloprotease [Firmicutes bacterium]|nr:CPBP family intramembrane metalloprotease [Bacillota bacterium]
MELENNNSVTWKIGDIVLILLLMQLAAVAYTSRGYLLVERIWASFTTRPIDAVVATIIGGFIQAGLIILMVVLLVRYIRRTGLNRLGFSSGESSPARILVSGIVGGVLLLLVVTITAIIIYILIQNRLPLEQQTVVEAIASAGSWQDLSLLLLVVAVLAPLSEEMLFRGLLYGWLRQRLGITAGIWLSGLVFAAFHFDLVRFLPLMLGGAGLAYLYQRTGSLYTSILAHAVWNSVMTVAVRWMGMGG